MALSLLCGGLGVASAEVDVKVDVSSAPGAVEVYTKTGVDTLLADYGKKEDVQTNKDDITALQNTTTTQGNQITANTTQIANNTADIEKKIDKEIAEAKLALKANATDVYSKTDADARYATRTELDAKADATALDGKADITYVDQKFKEAGNNVDAKLLNYATTTEVDGKIADEVNARNNAITNAIGLERNDRDAAIDNAINGEVTARNQAINTAIGLEATKRDAAIANAKTELEGKITEEKTARTAKDVELEGKITQNSQDIATLDKSSVKYDNPAVKDQITLKGVGGTTITNLKNATLSDISTEAVTGKQLYKTNAELAAETTARTDKDTELEKGIAKNSGDITALGGKIKTNADNIQTNANDIKTNKDEIARVNGELVKTNDYFNSELSKTNDYFNKELSNTNNHFNTELGKTNAALQATNKRTAGINRIDATSETTIENNVKVDNRGNVTADGKLKGEGVDAGAGDITTTGAVNAGSLNVTGASHLKGDVTMDKKLAVTGDTSLNNTDVGGALNVTGASDLKGNVTLGTNAANTVTVNGKSDFKAAVEMDKGLIVNSGDTTLKGTKVDGKLTVTDDADLKNTQVGGTLGVTGATTLSGELTAEKGATFEKDVTVKGTTNLKDTTVKGDLNVTGTITTKKMIFGDKAHNNYTEIDQGKVTSKNSVVNGEGQLITSSSIFNAEENKVGFANNPTGDQSFHKQTSDIIMDNVKDRGNSNNRTQTKTETKDIITDKDGNSSTTSQTASENKIYLKDKDGKNTNSTIDTAKGYDKTIKGENGETSTKQDELNITNTAQNGTITNDAQNIVNNASGNIANKANTMDTTVTGKATESYGELETTVNGQAKENFNGGLDTKVTGAENHTVTGKQINTVGDGQENIISGGQTNTITGGQINNITGDQTTTVTDGNISNTAKNITNAATETLTDKVGTNTRVTTSTSITDTVGTTTNRKIEDGKITDTAGDSTVTTENGKGTTFAKTNSTAVSTKAGAPTDTNIAGNRITTGRVDANELGVSDKDGANTADFSVEAGEGKGVKASAGNGTTTGSLDVKANEVGSSVKDDASGKGSTFKQRIDAIMGNVKTDAGESEVTQKGDEITSKVGLGEATNSRVTQKKDLLEAAVTDGTNYNISNDTANESAKELRGGTKVNRQYDNLNGSQKTIADGANTNLSIDTASASAKALTDGTKVNKQQDNLNSSEKTITNGTYTTSKLQTALDITNTAKDGTITNDAKNIVNNATGDMTNTVGGKLTTTVTGQATENFKGGLKTDITGEEIHTVTGNQTNKVTGKQTNTVEGGQENIISGGQINNITGDQTTTISGTQTTTATDINRNASSGMIDTIDNAYGTNTETKVAGKTTTDVSIKGTGEKGQYIRGANESRDYLIKGTLKNSETKTAEATSTKITDGNGKTSSTIQDVTQISGSVTDGTNTSVSNVKANSIDSAVTDGSSISTINQKKNSITSQVTDGTTITKTEQDTKNITNTAKDGTITNDAKDIVNNATGNMTNTVGGDLTTTVSGNELHEVTGTKTENVTGKVTENYGNGQETNVTGDQNIYVTGKQTNKIDGNQENTIGGNQTTIVTGDISNKAENITNEANMKLTDKVGDHTRVLDSEGITDTVGGSTFKQRIDKIMMESKDVSIKAEETLTNEAKVITNRASEVINNEAVNINNTATGIITSKASEIKNQADKLISNKVGENTWENMENGKITTSIKDGTKQNLTQSDAAGTTQSTVDGGKSTVTIQNADGLADAVTDGTNTSVQNQTASAIAAAVKDGAGNENASVANATTSVNTIKSGSKANTVISTADGTSFINSEAAAPVGDGTEVKTTIKGNTITTGKVTMDYAEVMKDLGVRGNANITGKTTTGSLEVTGTSTLKGDVTMESSAIVKKNLTVEGNTNLKNTKVDGTLDVTQKATFGDSVSIAKDLSVDGNATIKGDVTAKSYKVGDKTYISAAGINANDQKITNVADGSISEGSKDAVNGGQLYTVKNDLEGKVNKVGANAAAMANLHPMEFDPDSKWNVAAAIGNYGSETAAALGAFYRPNDNVMVNLSTAFGTGENMVGGGVSVRLGKGGNKLSREETNALKAQVADLTARMDALLSVLNPNMSKDFPDVPENHWAYEAVSRLAGNDIVQGYPDGEFHGERTMTRYEMAEIIYNALSRGAEAEKELVEEFKPELQAMAASEKATAERAEG